VPRVLITGCSSGFGLLTAVELATRGHDVVATVRDLGRDASLRAACEDAGVDALGGLDVVVNNAGIEVRGPVDLVSDAEVRLQFETNVFGLLRVVRATVPYLRSSPAGVVVNVSSIAGVIARPFAGIYAASKHAVEAISEAMHFELGLSGIRVHTVQPGQFPTGLAANTVTASAFTPDHAGYWAIAEQLESRAKGLSGGGEVPDPALVARTVADVVDDPQAPLRTPVGSDAELIVAARQSGTFEDYEVLMRSALDHWEGYRRERP
jgi:NAD(P)-dependent dehydrogenase (short-subunit alcohol dehydrogenase family)